MAENDQFKIIDFLKKYNINKNNKYILSVSGGVDSMTLLHLFLDLGLPTIVCHFNHQKRDNSKIELAFIELFCKSRQIPFFSYNLNFDIKENFHNEAHDLRKLKLEEVARINNTKYIVTAHHADDLLETILIKLVRGSNLLGYAGMTEYYEKNGFIYLKPLLEYSKKEIETYAFANSIDFKFDESNIQNEYLRNRIRHTIVPILKQENESLLNTAISYSHILNTSFNYLRSLSKELIDSDEKIDISKFRNADLSLQEDAISYLLENELIEKNNRVIESIKNLILSTTTNGTIDLKESYVFVKDYQFAYLELKNYKPPYIKVELSQEQGNIFTLFDTKSLTGIHETTISYNTIVLPLWARHRTDGDILSFHYGHKKLKKHFIDIKVSLKERENSLVIVDSNDTILYIPNYYVNKTLGEANKLTIKIGEEINDN
ncbi:MAG: tRNA lysidine(34) synthetase TilS [Acholeplasmatales bacterium]|jgi:tRNA(Ile)-lysidine synthetase-like protein|nr:tRNA lysidine(34) synthetase TilS [Acholeplasmatales bacterium]